MRVLTTMLIVGLCAWVAARGWNVVRFAEARAHVVAGRSPADALRQWVGSPGLTEVALQAELRHAPAPGDRDGQTQRAKDLMALLNVQPLSATDWLSLAGIRLITGQPYETVLGGLAMSSLTGPNEGVVMVPRALFGLMQWENLPAEARRRTIVDLAGAIDGSAIGDGGLTVAKHLLQQKSDEARGEIADLLRTEQVPEAMLARIGL